MTALVVFGISMGVVGAVGILYLFRKIIPTQLVKIGLSFLQILATVGTVQENDLCHRHHPHHTALCCVCEQVLCGAICCACSPTLPTTSPGLQAS